LRIDDLYHLSEAEIIKIIEKSDYKNIFEKWKNSKEVIVSKVKPKNDFYINLTAKIRYINPLVN
jgi:hypothetical protein